MISLFIDTSVSHLIIGICKNKKLIYYFDEEVKNMSSKVLLKIKEALASLSLNVGDINEIYVVNGPGSFTGIRVGVTIAKTIAWALGVKIYTISELQLLATTKTDKKYNVALIDARRGFVYAAMYNQSLKVLKKEQYIEFSKLKKEISKKYALENIAFVSYDFDYIKPSINIEKILEMGKLKETKCHMVIPNYLKKTEAEEKLND